MQLLQLPGPPVLTRFWDLCTGLKFRNASNTKSFPLPTSFYSFPVFPVPITFAMSLPPSLHDLLALHLWSPSFILQFSRVSRSLTVLFDVQHLCCGINFPILSAFHISRIQHIVLLCPHPPIPDLLSMYLMVSFILAWKLTSSLGLFLLSLPLPHMDRSHWLLLSWSLVSLWRFKPWLSAADCQLSWLSGAL